MDRPRTRPDLSPASRLLWCAALLGLAGGLAGCKIARPVVLPVVGSMGDPGNGGAWDDLDIYLVDPTGAAPAVRVTDTPDLMETDPDLNRDRDRLVYVERGVTDGKPVLDEEYREAARADGLPDGGSAWVPVQYYRSRLIVSQSDGADRNQIYQSNSQCFTPVWSHDGKRIAFAELNSEGRLEVKLINADGSGLRTIGYGSSPSWRKDDGALFYASIDRPDATEGNLLLRELSTGVFHELGLPGTGHTNLRNGVSVAYSSTPYSRRNETIWLMNANGGQCRLTEPGEHEHDLQPVFFDSEGELAFTRYNDETNSYQLMLIHRNTADKVATPIDQPAPFCMTRGGLWIATHYPR